MADVRALTVDLTPMLVGADNGGAKIFVLQLVSALVAAMPDCRFTLLARASTAVELRARFGDRMTIVTSLDDCSPASGEPFARRAARAALRALPPRAGNWARRLADRVAPRRGQVGAGTGGGEAWFCPFTATSRVPAGLPVVATLYDLQYRAYPQFFTDDERAERDRNFRAAAARADVLAAISEFSRDEAIASGLVDAGRVVAIPIQVAPSRVAPTDCSAPAAGLVPDRYFLYPANFWPHKNHAMLLTAYAQWVGRRRGGELALVCTGAEGARADALRASARRMGLGARVHVPGFLPDDAYAATLAAARAVIFPSLYEGFGMPVIEAMAAGVPVACGNRAALPEVAGGAALLFDPRRPDAIVDALERLANDDALRARLIALGRARAAQCARPEAMAAAYRALFARVAGGAGIATELRGRHADGWAGPVLEVARAAGQRTHRLSLVVSVPPWHPHSAVDVESCDGRRIRLRCPRGATRALDLPPDVSRIALGPTFRPADVGLNPDTRALSAQLVSAALVADDGSRFLLVDEVACGSRS
ncbi:MAG: glycosyltransferase family 4 protein [Proteobacteria bacterium]|nr:glycosyltransferase family 4 protein [Pseudomonadota bacterium]